MNQRQEYQAACEAAEWLLRFQEENPEQLEKDCKRWREQSDANERAWHKALKLQRNFSQLPTDLALQTLNRPENPARRRALKSLLIAAVAAPVSVAAYRNNFWHHWAADYNTAISEQREISLTDGSQLKLNTHSAVDVEFSSQQRMIKLYQGELLIHTGKDSDHTGTPRPFYVETEHGRMQALGTVFDVFYQADKTLLSVIEGAVHVVVADYSHSRVVQAGEQLAFTANSLLATNAVSTATTAWAQGQIIADSMSLGQLLNELSRYRRGWLRCDPQVAQLRISGVFRTSDTDAVLAALPKTLPVKINRHTDYWITVAAR